jgi:hypothetical protein
MVKTFILLLVHGAIIIIIAALAITGSFKYYIQIYTLKTNTGSNGIIEKQVFLAT